MPAKTFQLILVITILLTGVVSKAQSIKKSILFAGQPAGVTSFTRQWAYPWYVVKHNDGSFENTVGEGIKDADTAHIYFTANCYTNLQGGARLNYCQIYRAKDSIKIAFENPTGFFTGGFYVSISKGKFHFIPKVIYEDLNEAATYKVSAQKLVLYQRNYHTAKSISGYIDAEFIETTRHKSRKYYFRGYFDTLVKP